MKKKQAVIIICCIVFVVAAVIALILWQNSGTSDITVTAVFHLQDESGQSYSKQVQPSDSVIKRTGNNDDGQSIQLRQGVLHTGFDHGPIEISGTIPADKIHEACPEVVVEKDWPFSIAFYNTSSGRVFHLYLDIEYDSATGLAYADLRIMNDKNVMVTTSHWEGLLGEPINVSPEHMEI